MIIYGCITEKLNKKEVADISITQPNQILNKNNIKVKSLPGYGNINLKKKEIKPFVEEKSFIKIWLILNKNSTTQRFPLRIIFLYQTLK